MRGFNGPTLTFVKKPCDGPGCGNRRAHHETPDVPRGTRMVDVPEGHPGPYFCSIECQAYWKAAQKQQCSCFPWDGIHAVDCPTHVIALSERDHKAFMEALDAPAKPNPQLRALMQTRNPWDLIRGKGPGSTYGP